MHLTEARSTNLGVTAEDVANARQAATEAAEHAQRLRQQAVTDSTVTGAQVAAAERDVELADRRADHVEQEAHTADQARRLLALDAFGDRIDAFAAELEGPDSPVLAAVQALADASRALRTGLAEHDARVAALVAEARELGVEPATPGGPAATSAHVAVTGGGVQHGQVQVMPMAGRAEEAITLAVAGHVEPATALLAPVVRHRPQTGMRYLCNRQGVVFTFGGTLPANIAKQLERGEMAELPDELAEEWRTGQVGAPQIARFAAQAFEQADVARMLRNRRGSAERTIIEPIAFGG